MALLGILTCEILELEFSYLMAGDRDLERIIVLEDERSARLIQILRSRNIQNLNVISSMKEFFSSPPCNLEAFVQVLKLGLHNRKEDLQEGLRSAALEMSRKADALLLGYGLCGNALENLGD